MLHVFRNRLAACLLSVVYLTAGAAGNLLHSHVHAHAHGGPTGEVCSHEHGPSEHDEHNDQWHDEHGHHDHAVPDAHQGLALVATSAGHHDDCTICRAAGQRVVPVQSVQLVELCGLVEPLGLVSTDEPATVAARTHHSRAPPRAS